jgi:hypothetical protein
MFKKKKIEKMLMLTYVFGVLRAWRIRVAQYDSRTLDIAEDSCIILDGPKGRKRAFNGQGTSKLLHNVSLQIMHFCGHFGFSKLTLMDNFKEIVGLK